MLEVIHIINAMPKIGGAERLILDIARSGVPNRLKVITWLSKDISLCDLDLDDALDVLAMRPLTISKLKKAIKWIHGADILHIHLFPTMYLAAFLPGHKVYTEHNTWNRRRSYKLLRILERFIYHRYDCVVAISRAVRCSLVDWITSDALSIKVIDNGISLERFYAVERVLKKKSDKIILGMAGSFTNQKNQDFLVNALELLPVRVSLVFAGDGHRRSEVERLADILGFSDRVTFLGNVDDMAGFYSGLDIYIQSAHWEGFGLTVVEAMASGLPCLVSNVSGVSDVIGDSKMLFENSNVNSLVSTIIFLISSPDQYQAWSKYSLKRSKHYSINRMVESYNQLYETITSK